MNCWCLAIPPAKLERNPKPMKISNVVFASLVVVLLSIGLVACASPKAKQARLEAKAKVARVEAEKTALAKVNLPGSAIAEGEIEEENGKLVWSFDVTTPGTKDITEVQVDAMTGDVVSVAMETAADEAKEKKGEGKERKSKSEKEQ